MNFNKKNTKLSSDVKFVAFFLFELAGKRYSRALKHQNNIISVLYQMYPVLLIKALMISSNQTRDASHNRVQIMSMLCCLRNTDVCVLRRVYSVSVHCVSIMQR